MLRARLNLSSTVALTALLAAGWAGAASAQTAPGIPSATASSPASADRVSPPPVSAATAEELPQTDDGTIGDIVVTAQKRSERLQDVPLAVTAISGAQLGQQQIYDTNNLVKAIPSLNYQQGNNPANTVFRVRGIGTALFGQGVEPSVSVVVDGVVAARQAQSFSDFADLERIEVLRGPQGTLFGKNSTAGVINVVTARPSRSFEANGEVTVAEQGEYRVKGSVSGPISDTLRARVTGYYNKVGGYEYDVATRRSYGGAQGYGLRGKLEWDATSRLNFLASADYRKSDADCCRSILIATSNPTLRALYGPIVVSPQNRQINDDAPSNFSTSQQTYSLQGDWDLGSVTVTSISAYQLFQIENRLDIDGINNPLPVYVGSTGGASYAQYKNHGTVDLKNFTQELRVSSQGAQALTYVAGIYYSNLSLERDFDRRRAYCATGVLGQPCLATYQSIASMARLNSDSISAFGQAELQLVRGLKAIGGLRVQRETISVAGNVYGPTTIGDAVFPGSILGSGTRSASATAVTGKAGLQYTFSRRAQMYASYTRGYKGLGFDTEVSAAFATQNPVEPEHVNAYEVGFKGSTTDGTLSVATALFRADYTNLQIQANRSDPSTGTVLFVQTNAGASRTQGFEIEATLRPSPSFSVMAGVTYAEATVNVNGLNCPLQFQASAPTLTVNFPVNSCYRSRLPNASGVLVTSGPIQDVRGGSLPASPRWRIVLSPRFDTPVTGNLNAFVQANMNFQSKQNFAVEQDPLLVQKAYTLVDLSVGLRDTDNRYSITLFVKNLFDVNYFSNLAHGSFLASTASPNDLFANFNKDANRYIGGTVSFRFR